MYLYFLYVVNVLTEHFFLFETYYLTYMSFLSDILTLLQSYKRDYAKAQTEIKGMLL